jgi:2-C-methyl-D-erythritol 4-phosphate cytidylyltransferase
VAAWAIVVAAGSGDRFGGPKQYEPLGAMRVLDWSLLAAREACDGVVLVVHPDRLADAEPDADAVVAGGLTRSESVRAGLAAVPADAQVVLVHDAARPRATTSLWRQVLAALDGLSDAVVPAVPVTDTLRELDGGTVDRSRFVAVQTPQAFVAAVLRQAHADGAEGTDDASLVEAIGGTVQVVDGEPANTKITTPYDLVAMQACVRDRG